MLRSQTLWPAPPPPQIRSHPSAVHPLEQRTNRHLLCLRLGRKASPLHPLSTTPGETLVRKQSAVALAPLTSSCKRSLWSYLVPASVHRPHQTGSYDRKSALPLWQPIRIRNSLCSEDFLGLFALVPLSYILCPLTLLLRLLWELKVWELKGRLSLFKVPSWLPMLCLF